MHSTPTVLIVAQSGRMLAASALRGGIKACVVDLFGDEDTTACAAGTERVSRLTAEEILGAAERLGCRPGLTPLVYGSGVDTCPNLLTQLAQHYPLIGNLPEAVVYANNPLRFFPLLERCGIPHPETRLDPPNATDGWLTKDACGEGGKGVAFCANFRQGGPGIYYQRRQPGTACSLLFLAAGEAIIPIGFNTLWHTCTASRPFLFSGAINRAQLTDAQRTEMMEIANRLTTSLELRGLNSLDFIANRGRVWLLELNPRPSATQQLYDADWAGGLLRCHLDACTSGALPRRRSAAPIRAFRTIFAPVTLRVPWASHWPATCCDRPPRGTLIPRHEPVCTVHTRAGNFGQACARLKRSTAEVLAFLEPAERIEPNPSPRQPTRP